MVALENPSRQTAADQTVFQHQIGLIQIKFILMLNLILSKSSPSPHG